jgi:uncharacterized membrane protein
MLQLEKNIKNKTWWVAVISAILLLAQSHGLDLTKYIGINWQDTLNTIFSLLVLFGVSVDTTAAKNTDAIQHPLEVNSEVKSSNNNSIDSTTSNSVQAQIDTSASTKTVVDNPDNVQAINQQVNSTSAATPQ